MFGSDNADLATARILVASSDPESLEATVNAFDECECDLEVCRDSAQALDILLAGPPDLAILDVMLPGQGGISLCHFIKTDPRGFFLPVILLTQVDDTLARVTGIEAFAEDYVSKPIRPRILRARSRALIRMKRLNDEREYTEDVLFAMARAVEAKDPLTQGHTLRVGKLAEKVGEALSLSTLILNACWALKGSATVCLCG